MKKVFAVLLVVGLAAGLGAGRAFAEDIPGPHAPSLPDARSLGLPSESKAFTLSLTATLASWGLVVLGLHIAPINYLASIGVFFGPSLGFFYGGCWGRGLLTSALRLGVTFAIEAAIDDNDSEGLALAWLGFMVASSIFDCATVKSAVRKHNAAQMAKRGLNLAVTPFPLPKGAGFQVRLSF